MEDINDFLGQIGKTVWLSADGRLTPVKDLETNHLKNINSYMRRKERELNRSLYDPQLKKEVRNEIKRREGVNMDFTNNFLENNDYNNYENKSLDELIQTLRILLICSIVAAENEDVPELKFHLDNKTYEQWAKIYKEEINIRRRELIERDILECNKALDKLKSREDKIADLIKRRDELEEKLNSYNLSLPAGKEK